LTHPALKNWPAAGGTQVALSVEQQRGYSAAVHLRKTSNAAAGMIGMSRVLLVEDSRTQSAFLNGFLSSHGFEVQITENGADAIAEIRRRPPHVVLTDYRMPGMSGLELIAAIRKQFPRVPTLMITEFGNEDVAAEALKLGAVGYVPKRRIDADLLSMLQNVLGIAAANPRHRKLIDGLLMNELSFELTNDLSVIPHLVSHLQDCVGLMQLCDETALMRLGIALAEALSNAVYHGNLELRSDIRDDVERNWYRFAQARLHQAPYCERRVHIRAHLCRESATFVIRDEGPGFDRRGLPDPCDDANLCKNSGRGLLLIHRFVDEVRHNEQGNEITLVKHKEARAA
jgi:CheY-like chemotaxis protein/anti-sigma regulatory factor (Ser/Thr protein kinase)